MTGHCLEDLGTSLSWPALGAFLNRLDLSSETVREIRPEVADWVSSAKTNAILADIFDMLAVINANLCAMGTGKQPKNPKKYPRPGDKKREKIGGKNSLPPDQLRTWFEQKRKNKESR